jgi:membrane-associated phospholipid phosphatase
MNKKQWLLLLMLLPALHAPRAAADEVAITDGLTAIVPLGGMLLTYTHDDPAGRRQYLWSMGTTLVVVTTARVLFNDHDWGQRPNGHPYGFPSGHMAFFGAGAAFIQDRYGWKWGIPAWAAAGYTAYVRVEDDHHRWRDIIVATAVAAGVSQYFVTPFPDTTVKPLFGDEYQKDAVGLEIEYRFASR